MRDYIVAFAVVALFVGAPFAAHPSPGPDPSAAPGDGWVCLGGECRRPLDARSTRGRPSTVLRDTAFVSTFEADYYAYTTLHLCDERRFEGASACQEIP